MPTRINTAAAGTAALPRRPRIAVAVFAATVLGHTLLWHGLQGSPAKRVVAPSAVRVSILRVERSEASPRRPPAEPVRAPAAATRDGRSATPRTIAAPPASPSSPAPGLLSQPFWALAKLREQCSR